MKRTDFSQLQGIETTKRAIEICLPGYHDLHIVSTRGNGNTTLIDAIVNILKGLNLRDKNWFFVRDSGIDRIDFWNAREGVYLNRGSISIELGSFNLAHVMTLQTPRILTDHYFTDNSCEPSENVVERVTAVRKLNSDLLKVEEDSITLLKYATEEWEFNMAIIARIHEVASTIAILDCAKTVRAEHMAEAIQYFTFEPEEK